MGFSLKIMIELTVMLTLAAAKHFFYSLVGHPACVGSLNKPPQFLNPWLLHTLTAINLGLQAVSDTTEQAELQPPQLTCTISVCLVMLSTHSFYIVRGQLWLG